MPVISSIILLFFFFFFSLPVGSTSQTPWEDSKYNCSWVEYQGGHGDWKQGLKNVHHHYGDSLDLDFIF